LTEELTLGFMDLHSLDEEADAYLAALLVADERSIPVEFRCTRPVKPNQLQRSLYGARLRPYVAVDLCAAPLLDAISSEVDVLLTREQVFLDARERSSCPVLYLRRASAGLTEAEGETEIISHPDGAFDAIELTAHPNYGEDVLLSAELVTIFERVDLLEPFGRIQKALEILIEQDERFS
jgi:hypothetical protein